MSVSKKEIIAMIKSLESRLAKLEPHDSAIKKITQSVFDGLDEKWKFAAVDEDGAAFAFVSKPDVHGTFWGNSNQSKFTRRSGRSAYDATDWQNSLIEREKAELTGSDLTRAMLENASKPIMCAVSDISTSKAMSLGNYDLIHDYTNEHGFMSLNQTWIYAVPINNQGEPLTAKEVGL